MSPARHNREMCQRELRLFLEEICCDLCRFRHEKENGVGPDDIRITQEVYLGAPGAFADLRVQVKQCPPYFIEVKYGYSPAQILASLGRKYGPGTQLGGANKVVVVLDPAAVAGWAQLAPRVQAELQPGLEIEIWDERALLAMVREYFAIELDSISQQNVLEMRSAVDNAKGASAFGETWTGDALQNALIWHFSFWRLRQLRTERGLDARSIMPPGMYKGVVVVMADLCSFSSYVRDTREDDVIRHCLTTFYAKSRYEILNTGGTMYQFVGDEVIGLYGMPDQPEGYVEAALECAKALVDIGNSVSHEWQRQIDRIQSMRGVHIGVAIGDMQVVSLRPFSRAHLGGIGEVINVAARLLAQAGSGEIVTSNTYYQALAQESQAMFAAASPVEAKNMGTMQAWKFAPAASGGA